MKVIDLAVATYKTELNEDSSISVPSLCAYFRYNVGDINNLLGTCFKLNPTTLEIVDENGCEINSEAAMIYKYVYLLSYYSRQIRANLGIGGVVQALSVQSDGGLVKLVDKTYIAKVYLQLREDVEKTLARLVNKYKFRNDSRSSVDGDDTMVSLSSYPYREQGVPYQNIL